MYLKFFFSSLSDHGEDKKSSTPNNISYFPLVPLMQEIEAIYENAQALLNELISTFNQIEWHTLFIESQKQQFAIAEQANLSSHIINQIYNNTVKNWIHGVYGVAPSPNETIEHYSIRATKESPGYQEKMDAFKNFWKTKIVASIQLEAIKKIREQVEANHLENGKWINKSKHNKGFNYIDTIYQQCIQLDNLEKNPDKLFEQIQIILSSFLKNYLQSHHQTIKEYMNNENQFDFHKNIMTESEKQKDSAYELK